MTRRNEIRRLLALSPQEVESQAGERLFVCEDLDSLHLRFAVEIADEIRARNVVGEPTRLIMPVGPTGQYPFLAGIINKERLCLDNVWLFFMDENCGDDGKAVAADHPLSFKGEAQRLLFDNIAPELRPKPEQVVFPDEKNINTLAKMIADLGGIDTCYGGIGIHGHLAFNEPEPGVSASGPRKVCLNDFTVTINAIRSHIGGNIECFPREAFTIGMSNILSARRIRLYCRSGCEFDWANTVLRLALFGEPGDDYPVTHIRGENYLVATDRDTLASPRFHI
jgi:glucosamine-6-phosphate deaminase